MSRSANALQKAIYNRLNDDAALTALTGSNKIFDHRVSQRQSPYIVIADIQTQDRSTATEQGEEHRIIIEVWSDQTGRQNLQLIVARIHEQLHQVNLALDLGELINLIWLSTTTRREPNTKWQMSRQQFRAVVEL